MKTHYKPRIRKVEDTYALSVAALDFFVEKAAALNSGTGDFHVAVSGGNTPRHLYELLGTDARSLNLAWHRIHLFWVDERCVQPDSPHSNYHMAAETFLGKVGIPPENVHRICGEDKDPRTAARDYAEEVREVFGLNPGEHPQFDLIVLGMGSDGHTGSLFPDSFAPFETEEIATAVFMLDDKLNRITFTSPILLKAKSLLVLVSGEDKAQTLAHVLTNEPDVVKFPIQVLWPVLDRVVWLVDNAAASLLPADIEDKA